MGPNLYTCELHSVLSPRSPDMTKELPCADTTNIHATPPGSLPSGASPLGADGKPLPGGDPRNAVRIGGRAALESRHEDLGAAGAPDVDTLPPFGFHQVRSHFSSQPKFFLLVLRVSER